MQQRPDRLILIHGAWAGGWVWDKLVPELAVRGRKAVALELPGNGHHPIAPENVAAEDYLKCLDDAIGDGPVALVGHSGGGMLMTAGAEYFGDRVSQGIWIAGMLLPDGKSFDDIQETVAGPGKRFGVTPYIVPSVDGRTSTVPPDAAIRFFFQDLPQGDAETAAARLTPQPAAGYRMTSQTGLAFTALPKLYVLARQDRSVIPEAQWLMCVGVKNLTVKEVDSGHVPQISQPSSLAEMIDGWLP
ncbi:alpha/beta fold hydrolase [Pseudoruegeria sp. HB172150]|uniref:alpha/beta fold hydrolase n=1 Tax=Pseudoruegeria sp. HB172150 TaxID=2721164 RepID=UPI0015578B40|nr:alpha/beta fold hydrolase [Pseudoruegeria sp. HB172150]